jgi:hypothetical protein
MHMRTTHRAACRAVYAAAAFAATLALGLSALAVSAGAAAPRPFLCAGTPKSPAVLAAGTYRHGVVVKGFCAVNAGRARVVGTLTLAPGSAMAAAYGLNHKTHHGGSGLTVAGKVVVGRGATLVLGCKSNPDGTGFPCIDEPNMKHPTLTSRARVTGDLISRAPLGVIVHNSVIGGSVTETGGGGGASCATPKTGPFAKFKSPVFSDYEDSLVAGNLRITGLTSCWLGVARVKLAGSMSFINNKLADPDAIEILANVVRKNLSCTGNTSVWDSTETSQTANFPRRPEPNTVHGKRSGQCVLSTPTTQGGPSGPGPF